MCDECEKSWLAEHVDTFKTVWDSQEAERFPVIRHHQVELNTVGKLWWLKCATETKKIINTNKIHARDSLISFPSFVLLEWGSRETQQSAQSIQTGCLDQKQYSFAVVIAALAQPRRRGKMRWNARETTSTPAKVGRDSTAISGRSQSARFERAPPTLSSGLWHGKSTTATARSFTPRDGQNENSAVEPQSFIWHRRISPAHKRQRQQQNKKKKKAFLWTLMMM